MKIQDLIDELSTLFNEEENNTQSLYSELEGLEKDEKEKAPAIRAELAKRKSHKKFILAAQAQLIQYKISRGE